MYYIKCIIHRGFNGHRQRSNIIKTTKSRLNNRQLVASSLKRKQTDVGNRCPYKMFNTYKTISIPQDVLIAHNFQKHSIFDKTIDK